MTGSSYEQRRAWEALDAAERTQLQLERLNALLREILPRNRFYAEKLAGRQLPLTTLEQLAELPFTYKSELNHPPAGVPSANLTYPVERYVRFHQTSGTHGRPLAVLDTADDWQWWLGLWQFVLDAAGLQPGDRALLAFSFGPFIGFWSAHDAALARGVMVLPGGGMNTRARLEMIQAHRVTAVFCTPSYALHLAEVAAEHRLDLAGLGVRAIIVAGEPGGSLPAVRDRIEAAWNARVIDHAGATEVGPWGYADAARPGCTWPRPSSSPSSSPSKPAGRRRKASWRNWS